MADNSPPGESISEAFPGGFAVVRLRTQTLIILHLQPDDPDHKSGCSADDPASDRFVKEEYAPENGEYGHHALDHGNHIKGHQGDGFGIEVKAHSRDKAEGKDGKDAGQIRTDKSYFPCKDRLCGRDQGKKTGQGKYSQIAVDNIQPSSYHFLGKHMAACTDTGQDKQAGKKEIFFKKYIQRTAV